MTAPTRTRTRTARTAQGTAEPRGGSSRTASARTAQAGSAPARTTPTRGAPRTNRAHTAPRGKPQNATSRTRDQLATQAPGRTRSTAAQRAYARRAQRTARATGSAGPSAPERSARAPFVVLVMSLLVAGVASTLWLSTQATADSYRLERARQQASTLTEQVEHLQAEVARDQSPGALARRATELGMVPGGAPARLVPGENGKVRVVGKPERAGSPRSPVEPAIVDRPTERRVSTPDEQRSDVDTTAEEPARRAALPPRAGAGDGRSN